MDASSRSALNTRIRQQEVVAELGQQTLETEDIDQLMHDATVSIAETLDNAIEYSGVEPPQIHVSAQRDGVLANGVSEMVRETRSVSRHAENPRFSSSSSDERSESDGDGWMISICDEGIGIDPNDADRVFEVFQSLHTNDDHSGTGIGHALCERIVERHGGEIWVDSEPGEGATFSFPLPSEGENNE